MAATVCHHHRAARIIGGMTGDDSRMTYIYVHSMQCQFGSFPDLHIDVRTPAFCLR